MNDDILADSGKFERAYLIGVHHPQTTRHEVEEHLDELEALVETMGAVTVGREIVRVGQLNAKFLIGAGKIEEIKTWSEAVETDLIVVDDDLTPPQQASWEKSTKKAVIDRRKVILDIFAQRAMTREARLQTQLATLQYMLPRLKRAWTHLERQRGGGGFVGGAGEAQIETDRRIVRDRIAKLRGELKEVRATRAHQRKSRRQRPVPNAAIVGYTNSGKSSLLNTLTKANVLQEDKLFATLDPTTRKVQLPNNQPLLLTDTVGFIRKLPTTLVEAFKATLEEAELADYLVHVADVSHPQVHEHIQTTNKVLQELNALDKPTLLVLNKCDLLEQDWGILGSFEDYADKIVLTSATQGIGLEELAQHLASFLADSLRDVYLSIPATRYDLISEVHREAQVLEKHFDDDNNVLIHASFPNRFYHRVQEFVVPKWELVTDLPDLEMNEFVVEELAENALEIAEQ
ncbi:MAG: GTPase HflX [Sumerlaeia bacterium]